MNFESTKGLNCGPVSVSPFANQNGFGVNAQNGCGQINGNFGVQPSGVVGPGIGGAFNNANGTTSVNVGFDTHGHFQGGSLGHTNGQTTGNLSFGPNGNISGGSLSTSNGNFGSAGFDTHGHFQGGSLGHTNGETTGSINVGPSGSITGGSLSTNSGHCTFTGGINHDHNGTTISGGISCTD